MGKAVKMGSKDGWLVAQGRRKLITVCDRQCGEKRNLTP